MLTEWKDAGKHATELVVHRMSDGTELWQRTFADGQPYYTASFGWKDMLFSFHLDTSYAKSQVRADAMLAHEAAAVKKKDDGRLIEVVDAATGKTVASVVVEVSRAYAGTNGLNRVGDLLYATTEDNRTQVFSLKDGRELREFFGRMWAEDVGQGGYASTTGRMRRWCTTRTARSWRTCIQALRCDSRRLWKTARRSCCWEPTRWCGL